MICNDDHFKYLNMDIVKSLRSLLTSHSSDLRIICNDNQVVQSHKIIFGLLHNSLEDLFIQEEFTDQTVTVFLPIDSEDMKAALDFDYLEDTNLNLINTIFNPKKYKDEYESLKEESANVKMEPNIDSEENQIIEDLCHNDTGSDEDPLQSISTEGKEVNENNEEEEEDENVPQENTESLNKNRKKPPKLATLKLADLLKNHAPEPEKLKLTGTKCHMCGKQFSTPTNMRKHIHFTHNPEKKFIGCVKCDYKTPSKDSLRKHILHVHSISELVPCDICGVKVKQASLKHHKKWKHEEHKKARCELCSKELSNSKHLQQHMKMVHGERRHLCEQCSFMAVNNYNLRLHVNRVHLGNKELPKSQCEFCDVTTTNLSRHVRIYHADKIENNLSPSIHQNQLETEINQN